MNASHAQNLVIYNAKGGTGKTTTAHAVACGLASHGERVLVLDLDPQANLSYWLGFTQDGQSPQHTLFDVIRGDVTLPAAVTRTKVDRVDAVASDTFLAGAEPTLRARIGSEIWLRRELSHLPARWDWIVLDCAPGLGILTIGALAAAHHVLAPVEPQVLGLAGVQQLIESIAEVRDTLNPELELLGVLPVKVDRRNSLTGEVLNELERALGERLLSTRIRINVKLAEAPSHHLPIYAYAPNSAGAQDYHQLILEILRRCQPDES